MSRIRLLVVEDHPAAARGVRIYLEVLGYEVELADSVASALEVAARVSFDVLICDLNLPDGTGWDVLTKLSASAPRRAIAFSAYDDEIYREKSQTVGFLEYVVKGAPESLVSAIERVMAAVVLPVDAVSGNSQLPDSALLKTS